MTKRSGFKNAAADKIWNDHVGRNAFVQHRDQCPSCLDARKQWRADHPNDEDTSKIRWCDEGERVFDEVLGETLAKIDEVLKNQN